MGFRKVHINIIIVKPDNNGIVRLSSIAIGKISVIIATIDPNITT